MVRKLSCFQNSCLHGITPSLFTDVFSYNFEVGLHSHYTRISNKLHVKKARICVRAISLSVRGPVIWYEIPAIVTNSGSLLLFKRAVKNYLISSYAP